MRKQSAAYLRGLGCMQSMLATLQATGRVRFPPLMECARRAGVSHPTMIKVVRHLQREGVVHVSRRFGITCAAEHERASAWLPPQQQGVSRSAPPRGKAFAAELRRRILQNCGSDGCVEPVNDLALHYGVCEQTVRRGLCALVTQGCIRRERNRYIVVRSAVSSLRSRIVLVARGGDFSQISLPTPRTREHLQVLEHECSRRGIELVLNALYFKGVEWQGVASLRATLTRSPAPILGVCIWTAALSVPLLAEVLNVVANCGARAAVLDDSGIVPQLERGYPRSHVTVFPLGTGSRPGYLVAQYLLRLGHREFGFVRHRISDFCDAREAGFREACRDSGLDARIHAVDFAAAPVIGWRTSLEQRREVLPLLRSFLDYPQLSGIDFALEERFTSEFFFSLEELSTRQRERKTLFPRLQELLATHVCTAWVGASDALALDGLDFLRIHRRQVPREISVIGFDDSLDAFSGSLTSYNFNGQSVVRAMLNTLLYPTLRTAEHEELDGFITERATCAAAGEQGRG